MGGNVEKLQKTILIISLRGIIRVR